MSEFSLSKIIRLLEKANDRGVNISFLEDELSVHIHKGVEVDKFILDELRTNKPFLIHYFKNFASKESRVNVLPIQKVDRKTVKRIPLSFVQERLWFIHQLEGSVQYHLPTVLRLKGNLNNDFLSQALQNIVNRHEVLRTVILEEDGLGFQHIKNKNEWHLNIVDGSVYKDSDALQYFIRQLVMEPFNLSRDNMLRATLINMGEDEHVVVVTMHHIASDAWSTGVLVKEVIESYSACLEGRENNLLPLEIQYADYSIWQRNYLQGEVLNKKIEYWKSKLQGVPTLQLPTDYMRPLIQSSRGSKAYFNINKDKTEQLKKLNQKEGTTLFITLLAIYKVILYRYSNQTDICVGTSFARRDQQELESLIGFFVNTLALRDDINPDSTFIELLQQVKATTVAAYENQDIPFEKIVETVVKDREPGRNPLFQVMLVLVNTPEVSELKLGGLEISALEYEQNTTKFEFTFFIKETPNGLLGSVQYSTDLYKEDTINSMATHFETLLVSVLNNPNQKIGLLPMLTSGEQYQLLSEFNNSEVTYPDKSVVTLFEEQVQKTPNTLAVVYEGVALSYEELNNMSNQLAHRLLTMDIRPGSLVPLFLERSPGMLVGMLGIMKAGAAYVPIDMDFPTERISFMLEDIEAKVIVCSRQSIKKLPEASSFSFVEVDSEIVNQQLVSNPVISVGADSLAYVIYTSGSTGVPKGVMVEHRNLVDYYYGLNKAIGIGECRSFALVSTIATDLGNTVIYASLLSGGLLHLFSKDSIGDIAFLHRYFAEHRIECLKIVPSHWKALCSEEGLLLPKKLLVFGGEALQSGTVEDIKLSGTGCNIVNHYGPTETTIGKLLHVVDYDRLYSNTIPIGKPFSNTEVYILSKDMQLCPVGVPGQLYISGAGVSKGYLNNPELTKEKFITNPFSKEYLLMYGTGDLVRYLEDGNIEFIGRVDNQVKIRGYRIEPGEIENVLLQSDLVSQAVILAREDKYGEKKLVGYIIPREDFDREGIISYLKGKLPDYMLPAMLIELESFPLTANGKVDRKALPNPEPGELSGGEYVAPRNETEFKLAAIWTEVLEIDQVGVHDDFFELGGHSLLAIRLISAIRKTFSVELPIGDIFDLPTVALLGARLSTQSGATLLPIIEKADPRPERVPLSFSQERLWFIDQLGGSLQYHVPAILRLTGKLKKEALESALQNTVRRHEVLRTVYKEHEGIPYQWIKDPDDWKLKVVDGNIYKDDEQSLQKYIQQLTGAAYDLSKDYMLRATLIRLEEMEHILVVTLHHIASDGWSRSVLVNDFSAFYGAYEEGRAVALPGLVVQYSDYAIWQRSYLAGEILEKKMGYWKEKLQGVESLQLPIDYQRPVIQSTRGAIAEFTIDKALSIKLQALSQQHGATLFMTLLSGFNVLLYRYTGQQDICIGTPIAGRQQQEVEKLIGFFVNTLALRTELNGESTFTELLHQVRAGTLGAYENQEVPFEKVVDAVVRDRDMSRSPLFQVMFVLRNTPEVPELVMKDVQLSRGRNEHTTALFDLTLFITENENGMTGLVEYCTDLFTEKRINRMIGHFIELLGSIVKEPQEKISKLSMLTKAEESQLLVEFNDTEVAYPKDKSIAGLFEEQVVKTTDLPAVMFGDRCISYGELNERANQLAHYLRSKGVKEETLVPICVERSLEMIIGILGILKAGAAYVPLDPDYPQERIHYMINDINAKLIITSKALRLNIQTVENVAILEIDSDWEEIANQQSIHNPESFYKLNNLAYLIYTSGSTGRPKGVKMPGGALVNLLSWQEKQFTNRHRHVLQFASLNFDVSFQEIFSTLCFGGTLYLIDAERRKDAVELLKDIVNYDITHLFVPYIVLKNLADQIELMSNDKFYLEEVIVAGEQLKLTDDIQALLGRNIGKIINQYGPTEAHVVSSYTIDTKGKTSLLPPIGKPIDNTRLYILGSNKELVPEGVEGELYIGGVQVSQGYLNQPEQTAEKFIRDFFSNDTEARLYKTGDITRWLPDGNIEYLGRIDDQVKVRGYRIELGEIESQLQESELIKQAVVMAKNDANGNKRLVGYIVPEGLYKKDEIVTYAKTKLPDYMVPGLFIEMQSLPVTRNGKIDKKALPDPDAGLLLLNEYVAPRNETEKALAEIWKELLNVERISIYDNFFELGGHSLLATRVISSVRRKLEIEIAIKDLFINPTIESLVGYLATHNNGLLVPPLVAKERPKHIPLSFSQERLWFIDRLEGSNQYHIPAVLRLAGKLNIDAIAYAFREIVNRHEVLRTVILDDGGNGYQFIKPENKWELSSTDWTSVKDKLVDLQQYIQNLISEPFDLSNDHMLRAHLIKLADEEHLLVVTVHHIASDGWSISVIVKELVEISQAYQEQREIELPSLQIQYADFAIWQREFLQGELLESKLAYWKEKLEGVTPLQLPTDYSRPAIQSKQGDINKFVIKRELVNQLKSFSQSQGATLFMTLLATFKVLLHRYSGQDDICVGTPIAGRQQHELEPLVGFFINTLALRSELNHNLSFVDFLQAVKGTTLEAYAHQEVPFEKVVDAVVKSRDMSRSSLFQVTFVLQNTPEVPELTFGDVKLSAEAIAHKTSKFDFTFSLIEIADGINGFVTYSTALYRKDTIERIIEHFTNLLGSIIKNPIQKIGNLPMLCKDEKQQLLHQFSTSKVFYPKELTIVDLFEEQVKSNPEEIAVVFEQERLTYKNLNERANQLANYLKSKGVKEESLVPICMDRSGDMIIGIMGILKAGGAYVPIEPEYPIERIRYILEDTGATVMVSNRAGKLKIQATCNVTVVAIDDEWPEINLMPVINPHSVLQPNNLIYVIYTSGSTGKPKGVMIEHIALMDHCYGVINDADLKICTSFALFSPLVFDAGHSIIFSTFILGASLHVISNRLLMDGAELHQYINDNSIDCIKIVPSLWLTHAESDNLILASKVMIFGGEGFSMSILERLVKSNYTGIVYNHYGPTEATIGKCIHKVNLKKTYTNIPIGKPFSNTTLYVLDNDMQLVPIGIPGELYIAGDGLARGYLNMPETTAENFITNPFSKDSKAKIYKTGDLVRWLPDGNIEYLGRKDEQVKFHGYRIELVEIENVLQQSDLLTHAVVMIKEDKQGTKRLVGYVVPNEKFSREMITAYLKNKLPEYMIPSIYIELKTLPLTSNGKIDKKVLPEPDMSQLSSNEYLAPRNKIEETLAGIWEELIGVRPVGIHDNFFELGGDSIITIQVVSRARRAGYELKVPDIFSNQTIAKLSVLIEQRTDNLLISSGEQQFLTGFSGLLPIQQRFLEKPHEAISHYNQSVLLKINKAINEHALSLALNQLILQHDALRFKFYKNDGKWIQEYGDNGTELITMDLKSLSEELIANTITENADHYQRSLDIEKGDILKMVLFQTPEFDTFNRIFIVIHHLAVDGVSWRIILDDLELLLTAYQNNAKPEIGLKTSSYRQWYEALFNYGNSQPLLSQIDYWENIIDSYKPLPQDTSYAGIVKAKDISTQTTSLSIAQTRILLQDVPAVYHTEINDILIAALVITLSKWSASQKLTIGLEGHGRENVAQGIDTSRTVGWFTNIYPVLLEIKDRKNLSDTIKSIKEQLRRIPDKGLGFGVLKYINRIDKLVNKNAWDIIFNYLGQLDNVVNSGNWLAGASEGRGNSSNENYIVNEKLTVSGVIESGELKMKFNYSPLYYESETISNLLKGYKFNLEALIEHCLEQKTNIIYTPSDFGLSPQVSYDELDHFLNEPLKGKQRKDWIQGMYFLSGLQQGMLFHGLYDAQANAYTEQFVCELINPDLNALNKSWDYVMSRHTILRTAFYYDVFSLPVQCVYKDIDIPFEVLDFRDMDGDEQADGIKGFLEKDRGKGFDFKSAPLLRVSLIHLKEHSFRMCWTSHHILFDGWSRSIIMEEFLKAYEYFVSGDKRLDFKSVDRYEDYIRYLENNNKESEEIFWRHYMTGINKSTLLPFIGSTIQRTKGVGLYKSSYLNIDASISSQTNAFAKRNHITINTVMQGVWSYLLHQYTESDDIVYGVIVSGRPEELNEVETKVGLFINTLPLHSSMKREDGVIDWLQNIQQSQVSSRQYQYTPLQQIQSWTGIQGDLFDSLLVFENYPISELIASKQWSLQVKNVNIEEKTNYPLTITIGSSERINVGFTYNTELLKEEYITEILNHFENVLLQIISNDTNKLQDINMLTHYERLQLLEVFNDTQVVYPKDKTVLDLYMIQVQSKPDNIAVTCGSHHLTYKELHDRSNQLAHILKDQGVKKETLVPICIEKGIALLVGILGILKAGGVYVPIDPEYPADRINYMIEDSVATLVIAGNQSKNKLTNTGSFEILELDESLGVLNGQSIENLDGVKSHQLAYVIYTSGSTGKPKGAGVFHRSIVNLLQWYVKEFSIKEQDNVIIISSHAFDLTQKNLLGPLLVGATVVMPDMNYYDTQIITKCIREKAVTIINCAPHAFYPLVEDAIDLNDLDSLRLVILGGEPIHLQRLENWISGDGYDCEIVNSYGPTECTDIASFYRMNNPKDYLNKLIPMGHPNDNVQLYVLDTAENLLPVGLMGEIYIGGDGVGSGYLRDERLTKLKFIPDPFSKEPGSRLYKTGDLGRWMPDGNIEYLGRMDDQVKIRGYRIELGEIENLLHQHEQVHQAVVLAKEDSDGNKRLVGYLVSEESLDKEEIISYLRERVPSYMIPALWVLMESFPLTPNGKVDKKALPDKDLSTLSAKDFIAPRNEIEENIAVIWRNLLHIERIGIYDSFFELGGHSLLAMRVVSAIRKEFDMDLEIKDLFQYSTINDLSKYVEIQLSVYTEESNSSEYDLLNI